MKATISTEAKVGLVVILGVLLLSYMTFNVGEFHVGKNSGFTLYATFDSIAGVDVKAPVKIAGVEVGKVQDISLKDGKAHVTLGINPPVELFENARASIRAQGLMGEKYIEIYAGDPSKAVLEDGTILPTISDGGDIDILAGKLSGIADDIKSVTTSFKNVLGNQTGQANLEEIFDNIKKLTSNLNEVVAENQRKLGNIMTNFEQLSSSLNNKRENLGTTIQDVGSIAKTLKEEIPKIAKAIEGILHENRKNVQDSIENIRDASYKLNEILASVGNVTKKIDGAEGTLGKLVSDDEAYTNLNETLEGVKEFFNKVDTFKTYLDFNSEYLSDNESVKSTLSLKLQPREDKYFLLGIVNNSEGFTSTKTTKTTTKVAGVTTVTNTEEEITEDNLKFNVQLAKRFYDLTLRGGLIETTGGVGADYHLFDDKVKLSVEAWDFGEDEPHLKASSSYTLFKHIYLKAGIDDFMDQDHSGVFAGVGLSFEDKDIKYLLGKVPMN